MDFSREILRAKKRREKERQEYILYLENLKNKSINELKKIINKYAKQEQQKKILKNFSIDDINDNFILRNKDLKENYKKYKYIMIDFKKANFRKISFLKK